MSSSIVELRPNRHLLNNNFEGYKLNLRALPHYVHNLKVSVDKVYPDELQYSFVHAKLFALHNHLIIDYWDYSLCYYYIDKKQQVRQIVFENSNQTFQDSVVYDVPAHVERQAGHFNLCLSFPSSNLALISDGTGYLHIVETVNRNRTAGRSQMWQTLYSSLVLDGKYFTIVDSRVPEIANTEVIHCLLQSVEQNEKNFGTILTWVTFENDGHTWKQTSFKQLQGKGIVHYAAVESSCLALYIASDNPFKFKTDSDEEVKDRPVEKSKQILYSWLQTSEDITITLKLQKDFDEKLLKVDVGSLNINISYGKNKLIEGQLKHRIDTELTTWNLQHGGQLDILLTKSESIIWDELMEGGDSSGEQIIDASLVEEVHERLAHLCSETEVVEKNQAMPGLTSQELEDCDAVSEEDTTLVRLDARSHETTHRIPLSVHQYLFSLKLEAQDVPTIVLRHDVDACIWQPYAQLINSDTWPMKHLGTLLAFGYVQSSKQNRKFVTCAPNFSYSVVCEATRHIFVYKNSSNQDGQLRKRTGGVMNQIKVGQQHVFNIEKYGEVLGINATNNHLFVLTENFLVAIEIE